MSADPAFGRFRPDFSPIVTHAPWSDNRPPRQGIVAPGKFPFRLVGLMRKGANQQLKWWYQGCCWWFGFGKGLERKILGSLAGCGLINGR